MVECHNQNPSDMLQAKKLVNLCLFTFLLSNVRETASVKVDLLTVYKTTEGVSIENGEITVKTDFDVQILLHGVEIGNKMISFAHKSPDDDDVKKDGVDQPLCDDSRITGTFESDSNGLVSLTFKVNIFMAYFISVAALASLQVIFFLFLYTNE